MSEKPPELVEALAETPTGAVWRARQEDGTPVLAVKYATRDEAVRAAAVERLRRLARLSDPHLALPLGWWLDAEGLWYVLEAEQGEPFGNLPSAGFLSPQQASVISLGVLEGLKSLHGEGLLHGALVESNVRVLPDGRVRLTGHHLARLEGGDPGPGELAAEVRRAGDIVCQAFGIPVQRNPREAPRAVEHAAPALVSTARTIASGGMAADVGLAITSFADTAGPLARPERQEIGREELAALVKARRSGADPSKEVRFKGLAAPIAPAPAAAASAAGTAPAAAPAAPPRTAPAPGEPRPTWSERHAAARPMPHEYEAPGRSRTALIAGGVIAALVIAALGYFGTRAFLAGSSGAGKQPGVTSSVPQTSAPPKGSASPLPAPVPSFGPASAGSIQKVDLALTSSSCDPGQICTFEVTFHMASRAHSFDWTYKVFDRCSYATADAGGGTITATDPGGWTTAVGGTQIKLPSSKGQVAVVAVGSSNGDIAASPAVMVGQPSSCS